MPTYKTDLIDLLITGVDYETLCSGIEAYLLTQENGFLEETSTSGIIPGSEDEMYYEMDEYGEVTASGIIGPLYTQFIEYGDPTITVEGWLDAYYDDLNRAFKRAVMSLGASISGVNSYPLPNFELLTDTLLDAYITVSGVSYLEYEFPTTNIVDRVSICTLYDSNIYISTSSNYNDWIYYKAGVDGALDEGFLELAENQDDSISNPWTIVSGTLNMARLPEGKPMKYTRLHTLADTHISELVYDKFKDLQSKDYLAGGIKIDLENSLITISDELGNIRIKIGRLS
jgi:hypothetical protein